MADSSWRKLRVFVTCSEQAEKETSQLYDYLTRSLVETWWYKEDLMVGQNRDLETIRKIHESDIAVICWSGSYSLGNDHTKEVNLILKEADTKPEGEIFIIPVKLLESEFDSPVKLRDVYSVNWFGKKQYNHLKRSLIAKAIAIQNNKNEKIISPISLPEDVSEAKSFTGTPREYFGSKKQLSRSVWLRRHGFGDNPFSLSSFKGECDPKLNKSFVLPPGIEAGLLYGNVEEPGYTFLIAPSGGGKSSLCKILRDYYDQTFFPAPFLLNGSPIRILPVNLRVDQIGSLNFSSFVDEIILQSLEESRNRKVLIGNELLLQNIPPLLKLEKFLSQSQKQGIDGICLLIDNLDFAKIDFLFSGITWAELVKIKGIIFKVFLPFEIMDRYAKSLAGKNLQVVEISWRGRHYALRSLLKHRLISCIFIDEAIQDENYFESYYELKGLFDSRIGSKIPDGFVEYALSCHNPGPRSMWNLGYALLSEHFRLGSGRREDQVINGKVFASVINTLPFF